MRGSKGNQAKASKSPVPEESHTRCLIPPQEREARTHVKCYVRGMLITLGDQGLCRGLVMQASLAGMFQHSRPSRRKAGVSAQSTLFAQTV